MFAAGNNACGAATLLLDAGASMSARDRRGKGALDYTQPGSDVDKMLRAHLARLEEVAMKLQAQLLGEEEGGAGAAGSAVGGKGAAAAGGGAGAGSSSSSNSKKKAKKKAKAAAGKKGAAAAALVKSGEAVTAGPTSNGEADPGALGSVEEGEAGPLVLSDQLETEAAAGTWVLQAVVGVGEGQGAADEALHETTDSSWKGSQAVLAASTEECSVTAAADGAAGDSIQCPAAEETRAAHSEASGACESSCCAWEAGAGGASIGAEQEGRWAVAVVAEATADVALSTADAQGMQQPACSTVLPSSVLAAELEASAVDWQVVPVRGAKKPQQQQQEQHAPAKSSEASATRGAGVGRRGSSRSLDGARMGKAAAGAHEGTAGAAGSGVGAALSAGSSVKKPLVASRQSKQAISQSSVPARMVVGQPPQQAEKLTKQLASVARASADESPASDVSRAPSAKHKGSNSSTQTGPASAAGAAAGAPCGLTCSGTRENSGMSLSNLSVSSHDSCGYQCGGSSRCYSCCSDGGGSSSCISCSECYSCCSAEGPGSWKGGAGGVLMQRHHGGGAAAAGSPWSSSSCHQHSSGHGAAAAKSGHYHQHHNHQRQQQCLPSGQVSGCGWQQQYQQHPQPPPPPPGSKHGKASTAAAVAVAVERAPGLSHPAVTAALAPVKVWGSGQGAEEVERSGAAAAATSGFKAALLGQHEQASARLPATAATAAPGSLVEEAAGEGTWASRVKQRNSSNSSRPVEEEVLVVPSSQQAQGDQSGRISGQARRSSNADADTIRNQGLEQQQQQQQQQPGADKCCSRGSLGEEAAAGAGGLGCAGTSASEAGFAALAAGVTSASPEAERITTAGDGSGGMHSVSADASCELLCASAGRGGETGCSRNTDRLCADPAGIAAQEPCSGGGNQTCPCAGALGVMSGGCRSSSSSTWCATAAAAAASSASSASTPLAAAAVASAAEVVALKRQLQLQALLHQQELGAVLEDAAAHEADAVAVAVAGERTRMLLQLHMLLPTVSLPVLAHMLLPPEEVPGLMLATAAVLGVPVEGFRAAGGVGFSAGCGSGLVGSPQLGLGLLQEAGVPGGVGELLGALQGLDVGEGAAASAAMTGQPQQQWPLRSSSEWLLNKRDALLRGAAATAEARAAMGAADRGRISAPEQAFKQQQSQQQQQEKMRGQQHSCSAQSSPVLAGLPADLDVGLDLVVSPPSLRIPELDLRSEYKNGHSSFIAVGPQPVPLQPRLRTAGGAAAGDGRRVSAASLPDDLPGSVVSHLEGQEESSSNSRRCSQAARSSEDATDPLNGPKGYSAPSALRAPSARAIPPAAAAAAASWHSSSTRGKLSADGEVHGEVIGGFLGNFGAIGEPGTPPLASSLEKFHGKGGSGCLEALVLHAAEP